MCSLSYISSGFN
uniref:Uncharacterized protein n=1 Tax=Anguilla anguilla TaxID=7936 RepID=A0A0E9P8U7_ANGAN